MEALDGLRGLGVLGILLFHAGHLEGGWLGVDLFFVLSGFLITSLLLSEYESTSELSLSSFWGRRARRLLPALIATLFGVCIYAAVIAAPEELERIRTDIVATLFYVANWNAIAAGHDYWAMFRVPSPLDHAWSLAIEEQFYLLWPPVVLLVLRCTRGSASAVGRLAFGLALASAAWMAVCYEPDEGTARVYFGTDTRIAGTLVGAALAASLRARVRDWPRPPKRGADVAAIVSLLALCGASFLADGNSPVIYRGGLFAVVIASAIVVAGVVLAPHGIVSRCLSVRPLKLLGIISYGVYLWHWPIFLAITKESASLSGWQLTLPRVTLTLIVATTSYLALERPIRRGRLSSQQAMVALGVASVTVIGCAWISTRPSSGSATLASTAVMHDLDPMDDASRVQSLKLDVLLIGDSLAESMRVEFLREARRRGLRAEVLASTGCGAIRATRLRFLGGQNLDVEPCLKLRATWAARVARTSPRTVVLLEGWAGEGEKLVRGSWVRPCDAVFDRAYAADLSGLIRSFAASGSTTALGIIPPPIVRDLSPRYSKLWGTKDPSDLIPMFNERMGCLNRIRRDVTQRTGSISLDLAAEVCPGGVCRRTLEGRRLRPDGLHFKGPGAAWAASWALDRIQESDGLVPSS